MELKMKAITIGLLSCLTLAAVVGGCGTGDAEPSPAEDDVLSSSTLNGTGAPGLILTFDDGPRAAYPSPVTYTSIIDQSKVTLSSSADFAEWMQRKGVRATFFMVGRAVNAPGGLEQLRRIAGAGHTIGSHTWAHIVPFGKLSLDAQASELAKGDEILFREQGFSRNLAKNAAGKDVVFLRTPGGAWNRSVAPGLNAKFGARYAGPINWDIGGDAPSADWHCWSSRKTVEQCTELYRQNIAAKGGKGIVLLHDLHSKSALMAMRLIEEHQKTGGKFFQLSDAPRVKQVMDATAGFSEDFNLPEGRGGDSPAPVNGDE